MLDSKIGNVLKQHENDFLFAYKDQMYNVQKELKMLKRKVIIIFTVDQKFNNEIKIDEETLKKRSDERMNILEEEREWFRCEAIRLDKICKGKYCIEFIVNDIFGFDRTTEIIR